MSDGGVDGKEEVDKGNKKEEEGELKDGGKCFDDGFDMPFLSSHILPMSVSCAVAGLHELVFSFVLS